MDNPETQVTLGTQDTAHRKSLKILKGVFRSCNSMKYRQYNGQKINDNRSTDNTMKYRQYNRSTDKTMKYRQDNEVQTIQ